MGYFGLGSSGSKHLTASGVVGPSGKPIRVYNASWLSRATAGVLTLRNGTGTSDTMYFNQAGTAEQTKTEGFEGGLLFPGGCYAHFDANISSATIEISVEK